MQGLSEKEWKKLKMDQREFNRRRMIVEFGYESPVSFITPEKKYDEQLDQSAICKEAISDEIHFNPGSSSELKQFHDQIEALAKHAFQECLTNEIITGRFCLDEEIKDDRP